MPRDSMQHEGLDSCVVPASTYGLELAALSEQQQQTTGVREQLDKENSWCKDSGEKEHERPKRSTVQYRSWN